MEKQRVGLPERPPFPAQPLNDSSQYNTLGVIVRSWLSEIEVLHV